MRENKSKYAVLGILSMGPVSGYDIKKVFENIASNFWKESYGQIYPILKGLSEQGLANRSIEKQMGKPDRHIYSITDKGRKVLKKWLIEPVERQIGRHEMPLKLFFGLQVSLEDNIHQVEHFRDLHSGELEDIGSIEERLKAEKVGDPKLEFWLMTLNYGKHANSAILGWCDETLARLRKMEKKTKKEES